MIGRRSYRKFERFKIEIECELNYENQNVNTTTYDISEGGCSVIMSKPIYVPIDKNVEIKLHTDRYKATFSANIVQVMEVKDGYRYSFTIKEISEQDYSQLLQILHDRVPPLTKFVDSELGVLDELQVNIENFSWYLESV